MPITSTTPVPSWLLKRDFGSGSKISLQEPAGHGGCGGDRHVLFAPKLSPNTLLCVGYHGGGRYAGYRCVPVPDPAYGEIGHGASTF